MCGHACRHMHGHVHGHSYRHVHRHVYRHDADNLLPFAAACKVCALARRSRRQQHRPQQHRMAVRRGAAALRAWARPGGARSVAAFCFSLGSADGENAEGPILKAHREPWRPIATLFFRRCPVGNPRRRPLARSPEKSKKKVMRQVIAAASPRSGASSKLRCAACGRRRPRGPTRSARWRML